MPRKTTPSFIVELPLQVSRADDRRLEDRRLCATRITNVMIQHARKLVATLKADPAWEVARKLPRKTPEERIARSQAFEAVKAAHGFSKTCFEVVARGHVHAAQFQDRIGSLEVQKLAERVFNAANQWVFGARGKLRFKSARRPLHSIEGKNNATCLSWKADTHELQIERGFRLKAVLPDLKRDEWLAVALMARTKYCRLICRKVRGVRCWLVQLVQRGAHPAQGLRA